MKKLILILLCVTSAICFAQPEQYGPYDPGAMRTGQVAKTATGTAAAPAYTFSTDPDTGIFSPGANTIGFGVNGFKALTVAGIRSRLKAASDDTQLMLFEEATDDSSLYISHIAADVFSIGTSYDTTGSFQPLAFNTSDIERMRISAGGNLLIGTSTDDGANKLQVNGSMRLIGGAAPTATEGGIYFNSTDKHFYGYNGTAWVQLDN